MNKRSYDSEQVRQEVLREAESLFSLKGYNATSIADISRASGYSKGHIYYHFKSKEELFVSLAQQTMRHWGERWYAQASGCATPAEKLYAIAEFVIHNYEQDLLRAGQELAALPNVQPTSVQALYGLAVTPIKAYREIIEEGMAIGTFKPGDGQKLSLLFGAWLGGLNAFSSTMDHESLRGLYRDTVSLFLQAVSV
ncbi:TetR family transcriptional regulator [Paenibacillus sp. 19GGS1-52]|uniref:TetR/AcrR family transcriptional regulator n=1 Tax=Paenibacillus sp. 19GGS1-52 TaxID=2758563 RepID=UPI001EFB3CB4|nr:TetR/AcrR family transcriptional regulator [Paenibacillus sp. 19GGS1-52]ULO08000.1 TetR family transcriptional regulator [Paenibacillus sp. 19GGS1-52]